MSGLEHCANERFAQHVANDLELLDVMVAGYSKNIDEGFQRIRAMYAGDWPPTLQEVEDDKDLSKLLYASTYAVRDCTLKIGQCIERIVEGKESIGKDKSLKIAEFFSECNGYYNEARSLLDGSDYQFVPVQNGEEISEWYDVLEELGLKTLLRAVDKKETLGYLKEFQSIENDNWSDAYREKVSTGIRYPDDTPVECILEA